MNLAEKKKLNNIAEYIVHMYQTEDLIRAYKCDIDEIEKYVIAHLPISDEEKIEFKDWYVQVRDEMQAEGIEKEGHLTRVQSLVNNIHDLHLALVSEDDDYKKVYDNASPHIAKFMSLSEGKISNPIQICLNGIYGLLLLRMNGKKIDDPTKNTLDTFGDVLSFLSYKYQQKQAMTDN